MFNNRKVKIKHPLADTLSISTGAGAYAGMHTSEIAFFKGKNWVLHIIEPFGPYADSMAGDTRVYGHVPNGLIDAFLAEYRA